MSLRAQHSKYLGSICLSSAARFQKRSTFPSSTCIDLLRVIHIYAILYSSSMSYLHKMCCVCISSSKSHTCSAAALTDSSSSYKSSSSSSVADLFRQDQTHLYCHTHYHAKSCAASQAWTRVLPKPPPMPLAAMACLVVLERHL